MRHWAGLSLPPTGSGGPNGSDPLLPAVASGQGRALAPLAVVLVAAALFCGMLGYLLARQSDDAAERQRRETFAEAVKDYRSATALNGAFEPALARLLAQISGLQGLRFDAEPNDSDREVQSLVEDGRIVGWLSWDRNAPVTAAVTRLWPLALLGFLCLGAFIGLSLWHLRRSRRALAVTQIRAQSLATDQQTGLPTGRVISDVLAHALAQRSPNQVVALIRCDLDRFDDLADGLGAAATDQLLGAATDRLENLLVTGATLGAFGPGLFALVVTGANMALASAVAREIGTAFREPVIVRGEPVVLIGRVGFAIAPEHGLDADTLMRRAELASEAAAERPRGEAVLFESGLEAVFQAQQHLKRALKRAVAERAFDVDYQPIVSSDGYRIVGVEALLRWNMPGRGAIAPAEFIPLAEQIGLMDALGDFVLRRALADAARWPKLYVSVNLSPVQLRDGERVEQIAQVVRDSGVEPSRVMLEITEGVLIDQPEAIKQHLNSLRAQGLRIALDDFGAGYSSLAYLRHFPFDKLKVDKGFVAPLGSAPDAGVIIQAIVALGRALGLTVVVEGVETEEQRVLLRLAGCDEMQGFLFAKPAAADEIDRLLAQAQATSIEGSLAVSA